MVKKKSSIYVIIFLIVLGIILLISVSYFYTVKQTFIPEGSSGSMNQYTGRVDENWFTSRNLIASGEATIITPSSTFKFITRSSYYDPCVVTLDGQTNIRLPKLCYYGIEVYKDGQLLEKLIHPPEIEALYGYSCSQATWEDTFLYKDPLNKAYTDKGAIITTNKIPAGESGIEVQFKEQAFGECAIKNYFKLILPNDIVSAELIGLKDNYNVGDTIDFKLNVRNKLNKDLKGVARIKYELPTVLGIFEKILEKEADLLAGDNNFDFSLPASLPTIGLKISPSVDIKYPTQGFDGINIIFEDPIGQRAYNYKDSYLYGTETEPLTTVNIGQSNVSVCNEGEQKQFTCESGKQVNWCTCENGEWDCIQDPIKSCEEINWLLYISIGVVTIFIIGLVILIIKRRKR